MDPFVPTKATPPIDEPGVSTPEEFLKLIVNEGGTQKYASIDEALKALKHSQEYIPTLKSEIDLKDKAVSDKELELTELRTKLETLGSLDDLAERLNANNNSNSEGIPNTPVGIDKQQVMKLVSDKMEEIENNKILNKNYVSVQENLLEMYKDKAQQVIADKAVELGMSSESLGELAKTSPKLVLSLFNVKDNSSFTPTSGSQRIVSNPPDPNESLKPPENSMLVGVKAKDQEEFMNKIRDKVYADLDIQKE